MLLLVVFRPNSTRISRVHPCFGDAAGIQGVSGFQEYQACIYFGY